MSLDLCNELESGFCLGDLPRILIEAAIECRGAVSPNRFSFTGSLRYKYSQLNECVLEVSICIPG